MHKHTTHHAHVHTNKTRTQIQSHTRLNARLNARTTPNVTRSQHARFAFVLLVQGQTVIKQQTNKRFGFVGP